MRRARSIVVPLLALAIAAGCYVGLAHADHNWWSPAVVLLGGPAVGRMLTRIYRRAQPGGYRPDQAPIADAIRRRLKRSHR